MESKRKFWKGKGKGKESFPKTPKRNRKGKLSNSMSGKGKGTLSINFRKVSTTDSTSMYGTRTTHVTRHCVIVKSRSILMI